MAHDVNLTAGGATYPATATDHPEYTYEFKRDGNETQADQVHTGTYRALRILGPELMVVLLRIRKAR